MASSEASGFPIGEMDAVLAASAITAGLTLVTRNTAHFSKVGDLRLLNPWEF